MFAITRPKLLAIALFIIIGALAPLIAGCVPEREPEPPPVEDAPRQTPQETTAGRAVLGQVLSSGGPVADVVERVLPGVVLIKASSGTGTGFIVTRGGEVVTNNHVVGRDEQVTVMLSSGDTIPGQVSRRHPRLDIAHIALHPASYEPIPVGNSDSLRIGEEVIAIGYPLGTLLPGLTPTVSVGIVSAKRPGYLQTDASLNPGNSGGPLLNTDGEVIGVVVSRMDEDQQGRPVAGIGFAIPINEVDSPGSSRLPPVPAQPKGPKPAPDVPSVPAPMPTATPEPGWSVEVTADPVTDVGTFIARIPAVEHSLSGGTYPPEFIVSCTDSKELRVPLGRPHIGIVWGFSVPAFGRQRFVEAVVRWDDEGA